MQQESSGNATLEFANTAFLAEGYQIKPEFRIVLEQDFQSSVQSAPFSNPTEAADEINSWVANHTHDKIQNLVSAGKETSRCSVKRAFVFDYMLSM
jgi:serine protease inhibitor